MIGLLVLMNYLQEIVLFVPRMVGGWDSGQVTRRPA
jgi:hypothetical protein